MAVNVTKKVKNATGLYHKINASKSTFYMESFMLFSKSAHLLDYAALLVCNKCDNWLCNCVTNMLCIHYAQFDNLCITIPVTLPGLVMVTTPASPLPIELVATTENM